MLELHSAFRVPVPRPSQPLTKDCNHAKRGRMFVRVVKAAGWQVAERLHTASHRFTSLHSFRLSWRIASKALRPVAEPSPKLKANRQIKNLSPVQPVPKYHQIPRSVQMVQMNTERQTCDAFPNSVDLTSRSSLRARWPAPSAGIEIVQAKDAKGPRSSTAAGHRGSKSRMQKLNLIHLLDYSSQICHRCFWVSSFEELLQNLIHWT